MPRRGRVLRPAVARRGRRRPRSAPEERPRGVPAHASRRARRGRGPSLVTTPGQRGPNRGEKRAARRRVGVQARHRGRRRGGRTRRSGPGGAGGRRVGTPLLFERGGAGTGGGDATAAAAAARFAFAVRARAARRVSSNFSEGSSGSRAGRAASFSDDGASMRIAKPRPQSNRAPELSEPEPWSLMLASEVGSSEIWSP